MTTEKKYVNLKSVQKCLDCGKIMGRGIQAISYSFKTKDGYRRKYLCMDCEKYYKRKDPSLQD